MLIAIGHWLLAPYWYREEFGSLGRVNAKLKMENDAKFRK